MDIKRVLSNDNRKRKSIFIFRKKTKKSKKSKIKSIFISIFRFFHFFDFSDLYENKRKKIENRKIRVKIKIRGHYSHRVFFFIFFFYFFQKKKN